MPLAQSIAAQAIPLLLAVCAAVCLTCAALDRYGREWRLWQDLRALRHLCAMLAALGVAVFGLIAWALREGGSLVTFDHALTAALAQDIGMDALFGFSLLTQLGDTSTLVTLLLLTALVLGFSGKGRLAALWVALVAIGGSMNPLLKALFGRLRPEHTHTVVSYPGLSFPSGHAQFSFLVYVMLTYLIVRYATRAWHLPVMLLGSVFVCAIGFSRVILQVHYFSDVLAGWAFSLAWVAMSVAILETARRNAKAPS